MAGIAVDLLSASLAKSLAEAIRYLLKKEKRSQKDQEQLTEKITQLINLSNNTGLALERYTRLLKFSTEASVHSTEFQSVIKVMPKEVARQQFTKLLDVRMQTNLRKEGVDKVYQYREDYEKAREYYQKAEQHLMNAQQHFSADNTAYIQEMEYLNQELDKLVMMVKRRIEELIEALRETYRVFEGIIKK